MLNILVFFLVSVYSQADTVLMIGDSWAKLSGTTLENYCDGRTVLNFGVSGSTAAEFADQKDCSSTNGRCCLNNGQRTCNLVEQINQINRTLYNPTQVWLSLGGNDYTDALCNRKVIPEMKKNIRKVIQQIKSVGIDDIVMTAYAILPKIIRPGKCDPEYLMLSIQRAAEAAGAQFVPIHHLFGSTKYDTAADFKYFQDVTHLNELGYCTLWTHSPIQDAFHCPAHSGHVCGSTHSPTVTPTVSPTVIPSVSPTVIPSVSPTVIPTVSPTVIPTVSPTVTPTVSPTVTPTVSPTVTPTVSPTVSPTLIIPTTETWECTEGFDVNDSCCRSGDCPTGFVCSWPNHRVSNGQEECRSSCMDDPDCEGYDFRELTSACRHYSAVGDDKDLSEDSYRIYCRRSSSAAVVPPVSSVPSASPTMEPTFESSTPIISIVSSLPSMGPTISPTSQIIDEDRRLLTSADSWKWAF